MATILILSFTGEPAQQEETTRQTLFFFSSKTGLDEQHFALHRSSVIVNKQSASNWFDTRQSDQISAGWHIMKVKWNSAKC